MPFDIIEVIEYTGNSLMFFFEDALGNSYRQLLVYKGSDLVFLHPATRLSNANTAIARLIEVFLSMKFILLLQGYLPLENEKVLLVTGKETGETISKTRCQSPGRIKQLSP